MGWVGAVCVGGGAKNVSVAHRVEEGRGGAGVFVDAWDKGVGGEQNTSQDSEHPNRLTGPRAAAWWGSHFASKPSTHAHAQPYFICKDQLDSYLWEAPSGPCGVHRSYEVKLGFANEGG